MPIEFPTNEAAQNAGWIFRSNFEEVQQKYELNPPKYCALAEKEMSTPQKVFQKIAVYFLIGITCGCALKSERVAHWKMEVDCGKKIATIYCKEIKGTTPVSTSSQPVIVDDGWGRISIQHNGATRQFRDAVLTPGNAVEWNWNWNASSHMRHQPGVREADLDQFILSCNPVPEVVILSQGRGHGGARENPGPGILEVNPNLRGYLTARGVGEVHIMKTAAAIARYHELTTAGQRVAALIHTTC